MCLKPRTINHSCIFGPVSSNYRPNNSCFVLYAGCHRSSCCFNEGYNQAKPDADFRSMSYSCTLLACLGVYLYSSIYHTKEVTYHPTFHPKFFALRVLPCSFMLVPLPTLLMEIHRLSLIE